MMEQTQGDPFFWSAATTETTATTVVATPARRRDVLAVISLVAGLCGFSLVPLLGSIVAVITGHLALAQIGDQDDGASYLARAGLWLGYVAMALIVLAGAAYMLIVIVRSSAL